MSRVNLVHDGEAVSVETAQLLANCHAFQDNPGLLAEPYIVRSAIASDSFRLFAAAIGNALPTITKDNVADIALMCDEFGFVQLSEGVVAFRGEHADDDTQQCASFVTEQREIRIARSIPEGVLAHVRSLGETIDAMQVKITEQEATIRNQQDRIAELQTQVATKSVEPEVVKAPPGQASGVRVFLWYVWQLAWRILLLVVVTVLAGATGKVAVWPVALIVLLLLFGLKSTALTFALWLSAFAFITLLARASASLAWAGRR